MPRHLERHLVERIGWLRAAVLGANDGIVSTASLIVGVAAAAAAPQRHPARRGRRAWSPAPCRWRRASMSRSARRPTPSRPTSRASAQELATTSRPSGRSSPQIYVERGLEPTWRAQVALQLMAKDALGAHARDELGHLRGRPTARPIQAALTSAASFAVGAAMPLLMVVSSPARLLVPVVAAASLGFLALLGADRRPGRRGECAARDARVTFWGALAMALTAGIGALFGTVV